VLVVAAEDGNKMSFLEGADHIRFEAARAGRRWARVLKELRPIGGAIGKLAEA
jgi:hypothetical protein